MRKKLTLARVISNFLRSHPRYEPELLDINECMNFVVRNFAPLMWSTDGVLAKLQRDIKNRDQEIAELKRQLANKK